MPCVPMWSATGAWPSWRPAAAVSIRTLQRQFQVFLGKTPGGALREIRFERARRELLQGLPGTKVTDIALRCGFLHGGRFSSSTAAAMARHPRKPEAAGRIRRRCRVDAVIFYIRARPADDRAQSDRRAAGTWRVCAQHRRRARNRADASRRFHASHAGLARYRLAGVIRGSGRQTRLTFRLIETETGRHLSAHRSDAYWDDESVPVEHFATKIAAVLQPVCVLPRSIAPSASRTMT